jgi:hypothetical protein
MIRIIQFDVYGFTSNIQQHTLDFFKDNEIDFIAESSVKNRLIRYHVCFDTLTAEQQRKIKNYIFVHDVENVVTTN